MTIIEIHIISGSIVSGEGESFSSGLNQRSSYVEIPVCDHFTIASAMKHNLMLLILESDLVGCSEISGRLVLFSCKYGLML